MDFGIIAGDTDQTIYVRLRDSTTGLAKTGLVFNSAGAACYYTLPGAAAVQITLATQTVNGAHSDGGFVLVSDTNTKGLYRLDLPDAAIASGKYSLISIEFDGVIEETTIVPLTMRKSDVRQLAGVTQSLTDLKDFADDGYDPSTNKVTGVVTVDTIAGTIQTLDALDTAQDSQHATTQAAIDAVDNFVDAEIAALTTELAKVPKSDGTATWNATALASLQSESNDALVAFFTSSAALVDSIWDEDATAHQSAGSFGQTIGDKGSELYSIYQLVQMTAQGLIAYVATVNDAGASTTAFNTSLTQVDGHWDDAIITFTSGALQGQSKVILNYSNTNGAITLSEALTSAPANGVSFSIKATHVHPVTQIADAVLDRSASGHTTNGTLGAIINDWEDGGRLDLLLDAAGSAGDPWTATLPGAYGAGTAGKIVGDNLNATISSRSSHSAADVWSAGTRTLTALPTIPTDWLTGDGLAASAVSEIQSGLSTLNAAGVRSAVGLGSANLDTQLDALPTTAENAAATATSVFAQAVESGVSFLQAIRAIAAMNAGAVEDAGTDDETFMAIGNVATPRVKPNADIDGNRVVPTLTL
jgi:hypothetical protein